MMLSSKLTSYLIWSVGGLLASFGLMGLSKHLRNTRGKQKIEDETFRAALNTIQKSADAVRPGNKHDAEVLAQRLNSFIKLYLSEHSNQAVHFKPHQSRLEHVAESEDMSYTDKIKTVRSTIAELQGYVKQSDS